MAYVDHKTPPPSRAAVCWFLYLSFFHLLPVPWFLAVAVGLAPVSFLITAGMASLFSTDSSALTFGDILLAPAPVGGLVFYLAAGRRAHADQIATLEEQLAQGDPQAQAKLGRELLRVLGGCRVRHRRSSPRDWRCWRRLRTRVIRRRSTSWVAS